MDVIRSITEMSAIARKWRSEGFVIGLVPTMGYFHQGHLALMKAARKLADRVVVSLFVNPTQFGQNEDLDKYPRNFKRDKSLAEGQGVDSLFVPTPEEMYPSGYQTWVDVTELTKGLCGASRPGHFRGVTTVVSKLFHIVQPDIAVFGQKDFQQLQVIRRMVQDLDIPVEIVAHPIVREPDGLAMSSRNAYLSQDERQRAICLYQSLKKAQDMVEAGCRDAEEIKRAVESTINAYSGTHIDYIFLGDPETLEEVAFLKGKSLLALAVYVGNTRLIDNILLDLA